MELGIAQRDGIGTLEASIKRTRDLAEAGKDVAENWKELMVMVLLALLRRESSTRHIAGGACKTRRVSSELEGMN